MQAKRVQWLPSFITLINGSIARALEVLTPMLQQLVNSLTQSLQMNTFFSFYSSPIICMVFVLLQMTFLPKQSSAQNSSTQDPQGGMVFEKGVWRAPSAQESLHALLELGNEWGIKHKFGQTHETYDLLTAVIQQGLEPQPRTDLDAFVEDLFEVWISESGWRGQIAEWAITDAGASRYYDGTPYLGVMNKLIDMYESIGDNSHRFSSTYILSILSQGWGISYVWDVFNSTDKPPVCSKTSVFAIDNPCPNLSPWCDAGEYLIGLAGGPDKDEWENLCQWVVYTTFD